MVISDYMTIGALHVMKAQVFNHVALKLVTRRHHDDIDIIVGAFFT